jgi:hypothetical protein
MVREGDDSGGVYDGASAPSAIPACSLNTIGMWLPCGQEETKKHLSSLCVVSSLKGKHSLGVGWRNFFGKNWKISYASVPFNSVCQKNSCLISGVTSEL